MSGLLLNTSRAAELAEFAFKVCRRHQNNKVQGEPNTSNTSVGAALGCGDQTVSIFTLKGCGNNLFYH